MKCSRQFFSLLFMLFSITVNAQQVEYNLVQMLQNGQILLMKTSAPSSAVRITDSTDRPAVNLQGNAWLKDLAFTNGRIDIDLRGKNIPGQSFIGLAFSGENDSNYECVYFRPFNFESADNMHRVHMVQYMSLPGNEWFVLREHHPLVFENTISPAPNPARWFHATIVADSDSLRVYVNASKEPCLRVKRFKNHSGEKFGLWCSELSGDFANLVITKN